jgi:Subtilase family/Peptidase inhibitor I9
MKKINLFASLIVAATTFVSCSTSETKDGDTEKVSVIRPTSKDGAVIANQYLVTLDPKLFSSARDLFQYRQGMTREQKGQEMEALNAQVTLQLNDWLTRNGIKAEHVIAKSVTTYVGFSVNLPEAEFKKLQTKPGIVAIEHDRIVEIPKHIVENTQEKSGNVIMAQSTPCGITNAGGAASSVSQNRWIWVIDSGIDLDHPDLNVVTNTTYAKTFVSGTSSPDDQNGHGTHCAGTAAAKNNSVGVIGVAPGAPVVPVRVFGASGGSSTTTIINGINHVATYDAAGDVVNMSLGGYFGSGCSTSSSYKTAITSLAATSRVAIAAGNDAASATLYQPACLNGTNIFTVASMTCSKTFSSSFSNFGSAPIDWIATGSSVYSTYLNGGYATLSGTSMATPHVAGIMQVRNAAPAQNGSVSYSGVTYKIAVR